MSPRPGRGISLRRAVLGDLPACAEVWRAGLDDYGRRVGRPSLPPPAPSFHDLLGHLLRTDPDGFWVATRASGSAAGDPAGGQGGHVVGFVSATRRGRTWFLAMLFVMPEDQSRGIGRTLLEHAFPDPEDDLVLATCTDSAQPISNALYGRLGIVPRLPVLELVGRPVRGRLPGLPDGIRAIPFEEVAGTTGSAGASGTTQGAARLADALDALDLTLLGYAHREDHAFLARQDRRGFLYEGPGGEVLGYGYAARSGRLGPLAVLDEALTRPALGHLMTAVAPAGAFAAWVPGANGEAVRALLEAGLFLEDFPALLCWTRPFADFARYIPITLAIL